VLYATRQSHGALHYFVKGYQWMLLKRMENNTLNFCCCLQLELPSGLNNLGNTCYLNATLQCLRSVPELRNVLTS